MSEDLYTDSFEIAGLGRLVGNIGTETLASHRYIIDHAGLSDSIPGQILQRLAGFVADYQELSRSRHVHLTANCISVGDELRKAAWLYDDQEKKNYDAFNAHVGLLPFPLAQPGTSETPAVGSVDEYHSVADYGSPEGIDYPPPAPAVDDTREAIDEVAGWLGEIDRTIFELSGWSPLNDATIPITGNWNEIRRLGQAFEIAGNAMESGAASLERGVRRVDEYWNGLAAQSFSDYAGRQVAAMYWEGPCGRTISALAEAIADKIRGAVQAIIAKIVELLEAEVDVGSSRGAIKVLAKKIPVFGTAWQIESILEICWQAMDLTMDLVHAIERVVDDFGQFLNAITDPTGTIDRSIEEHLTPLTNVLDMGKTAIDTGKTADITPLLATPDEGFSVGQGTAPWQDA
nr:hypothetical protein [Rhodococcus sp. (in: high G+C Gram-positive bacteria)]